MSLAELNRLIARFAAGEISLDELWEQIEAAIPSTRVTVLAGTDESRP